jgi:putative endonuclease
MARDRRAAERQGHRAETLAALYLQLKGYRLIARRFKTPVGEIDLVMRRGRLIVFVEVKARRTADEAILAVSPTARRRILRAADWFIASRPEAADFGVRFDVVALSPRRWPHHLRDAFSLDR